MGKRGQPSVLELGELTAFLESIKSFSADLIFAPTEDGALFHYTDLGGLIGIVANADLWLTHSRYSNDDQELTHGRDVAKSVIGEARLLVPSPGADWVDYLDLVEQFVNDAADEAVYVCCFCKADNLLSQWRGYGANGTGVSIKFTPTGFSDVTGSDSPYGGLMRLWKVFYKLDQQRKIMNDALSFAYTHISTDPIATRARRAADAIAFFVPTFKNEAFKDEREWRLIFTPPANCVVKPHFRSAGGMLIPYYTLRDLAPSVASSTATAKLPINGVTVGPSVRQTLNVRSVEAILEAAGYDRVQAPVVPSQIPFRG